MRHRPAELCELFQGRLFLPRASWPGERARVWLGEREEWVATVEVARFAKELVRMIVVMASQTAGRRKNEAEECTHNIEL